MLAVSTFDSSRGFGHGAVLVSAYPGSVTLATLAQCQLGYP